MRPPPALQSKLAHDQFIQALSATELHTQTQLAHPESLQKALELALERERGLQWGRLEIHPLCGLWCRVAQSWKSLHE